MSEQDKPERNRPIETLRDGALKVSIFRNQHERGENYALVPGRIFTNQETGEVRETSSLSGSEPLRMAHLLTKGHDRVNNFRQEAKQQRSESAERKPAHGNQPDGVRDNDRGIGRERER